MKHSRFAPRFRHLVTHMAVLSTLGLGLGYMVVSSSIAWAQDDAVAGPLFSIGLDQRLESSSNAGLSVNPAGRTLQSNTQLSFGLTDETARNAFALTGSTGLRIVDRAGTSDTDVSVADPRIALSYARIGATSRLDIQTGLRINDLTFLRPLTDFINPDGTLELPTDFADLRGSGTRQALNFDATLSLREDAPFGLVLAVGVTDLDYTDVTDPELTDNTRSDVTVTARLDITEVAQATIGLTYATYEDTDETNATLGLASGLTITRPDGALRFSLGLDETDAGIRTSVGVGRDLDLPNGALSFDLGTVRGADGDVDLTGALSVTHDFALGRATASLRQNLATGSGDTEELQTSLSLGFARELTPLASLDLGLAYVSSQDTGTGDTTDNASLSASLGYALTTDWTLNIGYRFESRDEDGVGQAQNNTVFLGLSRDFDFSL